jgi:tetratricopeptide (TPR) repeat protein
MGIYDMRLTKNLLVNLATSILFTIVCVTFAYAQDDFPPPKPTPTPAIINETSPKTDWEYVKRGIKRTRENKWVEAYEDFSKAIELDPANPLFYYYRAVAFPTTELMNDREKSEKSIKDLNKAIELSPNYAEAYDMRGLIFQLQYDNASAASDFSKAIELSPKNATFYTHRMSHYQKAGKLKEAIEDATAVINLNPNDFLNYVVRGDLYFVQNRFADAINDYTKIIELNPPTATIGAAYYARGAAYFRMNKYKKAVEEFTHAINLEQDDPVYLVFTDRALAYRKLGKITLAKADELKVSMIKKSWKSPGLSENKTVLSKNMSQDKLEKDAKCYVIVYAEPFVKKERDELYFKKFQLLDICPKREPGLQYQEAKIKIHKDSKEIETSFEPIRTFADAAEAKEFMNKYGVQDESMLLNDLPKCKIIRVVNFPLQKRPNAKTTPTIALLDVCLPTEAKNRQHPVITFEENGKTVTRIFEVIKTFKSKKEAEKYALKNGITDVDFNK